MIKVNGIEVSVNHFPDGTQCLLNLSEDLVNGNTSLIEITWLYENDSEMATLMFLTNHLKENYRNAMSFPRIKLVMPYVPNARMDRTKSKTEVFTLKYFCEFINNLQFDRVEIFDPHSDVTVALLKNVDVINPERVIFNVLGDIEYYGVQKSTAIFFPDAGAMKRYKDMACFKDRVILYGEKDRDWRTGEIKGLKVYSQDGTLVNGCGGDLFKLINCHSVLMVDDIISYGGTLAHSADTLKELGAQHIYVYASHVENSIVNAEQNKVKARLDSHVIDELYTTNSIYKERNFQNITVMKEF